MKEKKDRVDDALHATEQLLKKECSRWWSSIDSSSESVREA